MSDTVVVMDRTDDDGWRPLIDPARVIGGIANSKGLIVATTLLGALLGAGMAMMTPKKYEAYAEILVDPRNLKLVDRDLTDVAGLPSDATLGDHREPGAGADLEHRAEPGCRQAQP